MRKESIMKCKDVNDMQVVNEQALIRQKVPKLKGTTTHPVTGETIYIEAAEAKYGFSNYMDECGQPQDFVLLGLPEKAGGDSAFLGVSDLYCAYGVPVRRSSTMACGAPVLLVWSSEEAFESGRYPMVMELSREED